MEYTQKFGIEIVDVNCQIMFVSSAKIINISIFGVCLKTNLRLNKDSIYPLELEGKNDNLTLKGAAVWANVALIRNNRDARGEFIPVFTTGMKFSDVSKEKLIQITNLIEEHKQENDDRVDLYKLSNRRQNGRSHITDLKRTILNFSVNCKIQELGIGGMIIKSRHELEAERRVFVIMTFPEGESLEIKGRIVSCSFVGGIEAEQVFNAGIEFAEVSEGDRERLKRFIRSSIVSNSVKKIKP